MNMKPLNRYEIIGITVSIILVIIVLGVTRFFPFSYNEIETVSTSESDVTRDIIRVDPEAQNKEAALKQAILDGSTREGRVTKLIVHDISVGSGREVKVGDTVTVHYIGLLKDGPQFDNSYKKKKPFLFKVGASQVIEGWDRGIIGMKEGGERILVVPASMGYSNTIVGPLPANSTLIFLIELLLIE